MKAIITILLAFILSVVPFKRNYAVDYFGDLIIRNSSGLPMTMKFELVSIPFEGKTSTDMFATNRGDSLQNGSFHRHFYTGNTNYSDIPFLISLTRSGTNHIMLDLGHCFGEEFSSPIPDGLWGFALYRVTIDIPAVNEHYMFYLNSLDSKYGKDDFPNDTINYHEDWEILFDSSLTPNKRILIKDGIHASIIFDTVSTSDSGKIFSLWELKFRNTSVFQTQPFERKFYARTTPFGINHTIAENYAGNYILGTTVVMDTVLPNRGAGDKYGYNTVNDSGTIYEYYSGFRIPQTCVTCVPGNVFTTPGTVFYNFEHDRFEGVKLTAEIGDTMIIKRNKRLYVIGPNAPPIGDTLHFKPGSKLIMEEGAEIASAFGGVLIDESGNVSYASGSCFYAFAGSTVEIRANKTVNNGALLVAGRNGTLKIGDNKTITIDGANSRFICLPGANVVMGNNSKIIVKNGAYVYADSTNFTSSGLWEGIYFENAGSSTDTSKILNSVFTNAKIPIKIYNTSTSTANNNIRIEGNNITVPNGGTYGIYADHINKILINNNHFYESSSSPKPSIYIKHPYQGDGLPGGGPSPSYSLNIVNNKFHNTGIGMILAGYTSALIPYYVYGNTDSVKSYGLIGRRITGVFKNNNIITTGNRNFLIHQSNPDFYNNEIISVHADGTGLVLLDGSTPKLAPYIPSEEDFVW